MYEGPALKFPKFPVKLSEHGHAEMENPPLLGQHSDVILNELGYSNERIEYLRREKVIE
jgi:crotonobetainyl-CoA:carnitine CoA-transferase CaiB-like acyl-CoA transferase